MTTTTNTYTKLQELIKHYGGDMTWCPMVPGGYWRFTWLGREGRFHIQNSDVNELDKLYVRSEYMRSKYPNPKTSTEYADHDAELVDEAATFWEIIGIIQAGS